jgi:RNA polymerase sigma-70 factor (ECF subfamily)
VDNDLTEEQTALARAQGGDEAAFASAVAAHERSLFRHCYRMLGSGPDAEDALQETLFRAWRRLDSFDAAGAFGGWLYRIATNVCLDALRSKRARVDPVSIGPPSDPGSMPGAPDPELFWVEPVGNASIADLGDPQDEIVKREDISLAFVAALQRLAPRQRACLLLHDVLGFNQAEVAEALDISGPSVNRLLFRARQAVRPRGSAPPVTRSDPRLNDLLERYLRAWQLADIDEFVKLVAEDVRFSMPPLKEWFDGRQAVTAFVEAAIFAAARPYGVALRPGWCNQQPAFATYEPGPDGTLCLSGLQVLEVREIGENPLVAEIISYRNAVLAARCGFPEDFA